MQPDDLDRASVSEPPEPLGTTAAATGTVKWWHADRGHGVIATEATAPWDVWCHFSAIAAPGFRALAMGAAVSVEYVRADQESFRYRALAVRPLGAH
jgi:CspA family cold shock protein